MRWLRRRKAYRVLVQTTEDQSIEGTLVSVTRDGLALRNGRYLGESGAVTLAGEVFILREKVAFVQMLEAPSPK